MIVITFLKLLRDEYLCVPRSKEGAKLDKPSNSELHRWCKKNGVLLNGVYAQPKDEVFFPVTELTFFPKNDKARCSVHMVDEGGWSELYVCRDWLEGDTRTSA